MNAEKMDALINAIRILKMKKITYDYIVNNQEEIILKLDLFGLDGSDSTFFESVKKAMKLV